MYARRFRGTHGYSYCRFVFASVALVFVLIIGTCPPMALGLGKASATSKLTSLELHRLQVSLFSGWFVLVACPWFSAVWLSLQPSVRGVAPCKWQSAVWQNHFQFGWFLNGEGRMERWSRPLLSHFIKLVDMIGDRFGRHRLHSMAALRRAALFVQVQWEPR